MTVSQYAMVEKLLTKKGQIATITTTRPMKVRKGQPVITKTSTFQTRIGVDYDNIKSVKEKRESGDLPEENQGLKYGEWHIFPYIIKHNDDYQVRCSRFNSKMKPITVYLQEGKVIDADTAKIACLASEFKSSDSEVFNIKVSSIVDVK
jgi:hypothetical protein